VCVFGGVSILICTNMMQRNHVGPQLRSRGSHSARVHNRFLKRNQ
jgi:hypothetical protein